MYYLYVKTHNQTGLKYLGQTVRDPYKYKGSGKRWKNHLAYHGYDISTKILLVTESKEEMIDTAIFFSNLFDVVKSPEWANIVAETGTGFGSDQAKELNRQRMLDGTHPFIQPDAKCRNPSSETKKKMSDAKRNKYNGPDNPNFGKAWTSEQRQRQSENMKGRYIGENNPMHGVKRPDTTERNKLPKRWVTNGVDDKLILRDDVTRYLSQGYCIGRSKVGNS